MHQEYGETIPGADAAPREFPPVVYLPCAEHVRDPADAVVELREVEGDRLALMTYSALDRLKWCCGGGQPWMVVPANKLEAIRQVQPFDLVLLDLVIPPELRNHGDTPEMAGPPVQEVASALPRHTVGPPHVTR